LKNQQRIADKTSIEARFSTLLKREAVQLGFDHFSDSASGDDVGFLKHERKVETLSVILSSNDEVGFRRQVKWPKFQKRDTFISERA
jgi:hypothetical protein